MCKQLEKNLVVETPFSKHYKKAAGKSSIFCTVFSVFAETKSQFLLTFCLFTVIVTCTQYSILCLSVVCWANSVMHITVVAVWKLGHVLLWFSTLTCYWFGYMERNKLYFPQSAALVLCRVWWTIFALSLCTSFTVL